MIKNKINKTAVMCLIANLFIITQTNLVSAQEVKIDNNALYAEPGISSDGKEIAFISGGDIWTVSADGGEARLLIAHPSNESRPLFSPDGKHIAFVSTRTGNGDIYVLGLKSGSLKRLTFDDGYEELSSWSTDGKNLYFQSSSNDIAGMNDIYNVSVNGGAVMPVSADRYASEYHGMPSPDGSRLVFAAKGIAAAQWWRKGSSHIDQTEIWIRSLTYQKDSPKLYKKITNGGAKEVWPMWHIDGKSLFYISDRSGSQNLWKKTENGFPSQLTLFKNGRVLWPSISPDGLFIVFERNWKIWKYNVSTNKIGQLPITLKGVNGNQNPVYQQLSTNFSDLKVSPDGLKVAFISHGKLFAGSAKTAGEALRISQSLDIESSPLWTNDSSTLIYVSHSMNGTKMFKYEFNTGKLSDLAVKPGDYSSLVFSPDGKKLAYVRNSKELCLLGIRSMTEAVVYTGYFGRISFSSSESIAWSPDNQWLAFANYGDNAIRNITVVNIKGGKSQPVSFLSNAFGNGLNWSADGKYIYFGTSQRTENARIARVELAPEVKPFEEDKFLKLFAEKPANDSIKLVKAKKGLRLDTNKTVKASGDVKIDFKDIKSRLKLLPFNANVSSYTVSKDGKKMLFTVEQLEQQALFLYDLNELPTTPAPQLVHNSKDRKNTIQFTADGEQAYYLQDGKIFYINLNTAAVKPLAVTTNLNIDFDKEKSVILYQAWEALNKGFYDSNFHGTDWNEVLKEYMELAKECKTPEELNRILNLMVGELNASHTGVAAPRGSLSVKTGRLGLRFDPIEYKTNGRFKISELIASGPAALSGKIHKGDYLESLNGIALSKDVNLEELMENKISKKTVIGIKASKGNAQQNIALLPVNMTDEKQYLYRQWVEQQRQYVEKISGGRLGYVHMFNMSAEALEQLYIDLDAQTLTKEGIVIDVRNNNGGFVNSYALDVFSRKSYLTMTSRDMPAAPARIQLGQRALQKPTILLTNQHSLSDAEDFTEGYRTLKLGKVVGEPTAGWIIFTSSTQLIDGSSVRLPFSKITDHEGKNMELNPRKVDVNAVRPIGESYGENMIQIETAVRELINEIDVKRQ